MKEIKLTQEQITLVDNCWFDELNKDKWQARYDPHTNSFYAVRSPKRVLGKRTPIHMHAVVAGTPKGMLTDHINGNTLDNRSENLRICTVSQNNMNSKKRSGNISGYKGVTSHGSGWRAQLQVEGNKIRLGTYKTPEEAARVYDVAAKKYHGEFARLNFG